MIQGRTSTQQGSTTSTEQSAEINLRTPLTLPKHLWWLRQRSLWLSHRTPANPALSLPLKTVWRARVASAAELLRRAASSSEVLGVRSGIPLPNDAPDSHATMETPVSAAPAPIMLATESSALSSGRDRPSAIQEGEPVADERNLRSELDAPGTRTKPCARSQAA